MAANAERGEVDITVGGKTLTLKLSTNAAVELETKYKKPIGQIIVDAGGLDYRMIRGILWVLLQKHHKKEFPTEDKVGELIDDAGGVKVVFGAIDEINRINNPPDEVAKDPDPNAQTQASGTGENSTSGPDPSA